MDNTILKVQNLVKKYGKGETELLALNNVSFELRRGEFAAVTGESGSGNRYTSPERTYPDAATASSQYTADGISALFFSRTISYPC